MNEGFRPGVGYEKGDLDGAGGVVLNQSFTTLYVLPNFCSEGGFY